MSDYVKDVLVGTDWVADHLGDDSIRIVEVDENPSLYAESHIPGAIGFDWKTDLQDQVKRDFLSPEAFGELFGSRGIGNEHTIVLYGDPIIAYCRIGERSAHTWFVLHELLGQGDVKNYDGSWTEWGNMVAVPIEKNV